MVTADPEQLKRVINNIINNACKYNNKAKGKVGITLTEYDRKVQVAIKDNGIGISKEDLPHIFRRTYRADMSRNSAGGSGLGLSICKKIIEEHGGEIWAESKLRAGTTIFFTPVSYTHLDVYKRQGISLSGHVSNVWKLRTKICKTVCTSWRSDAGSSQRLYQCSQRRNFPWTRKYICDQ